TVICPRTRPGLSFHGGRQMRDTNTARMMYVLTCALGALLSISAMSAEAGSFSAVLDLSSLNGTNGFRIDGVLANDGSGTSVAGGGDVNNDGIADLIIGAPFADPDGNNFAGSTFVVFGKATGFHRRISLSSLDGSNGFRIDGMKADELSGASVASA